MRRNALADSDIVRASAADSDTGPDAATSRPRRRPTPQSSPGGRGQDERSRRRLLRLLRPARIVMFLVLAVSLCGCRGQAPSSDESLTVSNQPLVILYAFAAEGAQLREWAMIRTDTGRSPNVRSMAFLSTPALPGDLDEQEDSVATARRTAAIIVRFAHRCRMSCMSPLLSLTGKISFPSS